MRSAVLFTVLAAGLAYASPIDRFKEPPQTPKTFEDYDTLEWYLAPEFGGPGNGIVTSDVALKNLLKGLDTTNLFDCAVVTRPLRKDKRSSGRGMTNGGTRTLTKEERDAWKIPVRLTAASYCLPEPLRTWSCGDHCIALGDLKMVAQGGDADETPRWYVATSGETAYVAIQGTSGTLESNLNNLQMEHVYASPDYFPDNNGSLLHDGFYDGFARMGRKIAIALSTQVGAGITDVVLTGHSQGAAIAQILSVALPNFFPGVKVTSRTIAPPRVGNAAWADYVDARLGENSQYLVLGTDVVPHLPPPFGDNYRHSGNEVYLPNADAEGQLCSGQENEACSAKRYYDDAIQLTLGVLEWQLGKVRDHVGPFFGIYMFCA